MPSLCPECRSLFRGHWARKPSNLKSDSSSISSNDFYEQPDWVQCESGAVDPALRTDLQNYRSPIHHDLCSLKMSALSGCHLCSMIVDAIPEKYDGHQASDHGLWLMYRETPERFRGVVVIRPNEDEQKERLDLMFEITYFIDARYDDVSSYFLTVSFELRPAEDMHPSRQILPCPSPSSQSIDRPSADLRSSTLEHLTCWITDCIEHHTECKTLHKYLQSSQSSFFLPTRLIEITSEGNETLFLRLCETKSFLEKVPYTTLSHCWGSTLHNSLIMENYEQYLETIPLTGLSKNFLDAASVTKSLGIKYMWIDALCIIQNSDDWEQEALLMASVYSSSYINLAATASKDGDGGLFDTNATILPIRPCFIETSWVGLPSGTYFCHDDGQWNRKIELARLNRRAWVLQERFLSPRTLHFAQNQLWWECGHHRASETWPLGLPEGRFSIYTDAVTEFRHFNTNDAHDQYNAWLRVVRTYSTCGLTIPGDKLTAITGIAKTVQAILDRTPDDYVAGHWKGSLPMSLLWSKRSPGSRPSGYRAPTWSWASIEGEVYCGTSKDQMDIRHCAAKVERTYVDTGSLGSYGSVRSGYIHVTGPLYSAKFLDTDFSNFKDQRMEKLIINDIEFLHDDTFTEALDDDKLYRADIPQALILRVFTTATPHTLGMYMSEGLILERASDEVGVLRRLGWVRLFHDDVEDEIHARLTRVLEAENYEADLDNGFYRFSII